MSITAWTDQLIHLKKKTTEDTEFPPQPPYLSMRIVGLIVSPAGHELPCGQVFSGFTTEVAGGVGEGGWVGSTFIEAKGSVKRADMEWRGCGGVTRKWDMI